MRAALAPSWLGVARCAGCATAPAPTPRSRAGEVALTLSDPDLLVEGLAHDPQSGAFFLSSVRGWGSVGVASPAAAPRPATILRLGLE